MWRSFTLYWVGVHACQQGRAQVVPDTRLSIALCAFSPHIPPCMASISIAGLAALIVSYRASINSPLQLVYRSDCPPQREA